MPEHELRLLALNGGGPLRSFDTSDLEAAHRRRRSGVSAKVLRLFRHDPGDQRRFIDNGADACLDEGVT